MTHLLAPERFWQCPSCGLQDRTVEARPHTRMHACRALGLTVPMALVPPKRHNGELERGDVRHVVVEREDYIGDELVDSPVMAVRTERPDGSNDLTVYPATATNK